MAIASVAILASVIAAKPAEAATSLSAEAEKMRGAGKVFRDRAASRDRAKVFYGNGEISKQVSGSIRFVTVRARGDKCGKSLRMTVMVDGKRIMVRPVKNQRKWAYYRKITNIPNGNHKVRVKFTNDRKTRKCDRNLRVDKMQLRLVRSAPTPDSGGDSGSGSNGAIIKPTCENSLQALVDAASVGGTVEAPGGCIYRESVTINKPLTLKGGPGVSIRGSEVWKGWTKSGSYWKKGTLPRFETITKISDPQHPYPCQDGTSRCKWPEQVFFDGKPLTQVASAPKSGQFAVNDNRKVILADNPDGHKVEVAIRKQWIRGRTKGVTIEGFTMKHAANSVQSAAISNNGYANWKLLDNDLSYAHGVIVSFSGAGGLKIANNNIHHAGRLSVSSGRASLVLQNNQIHHNNTEEFYPGWSSGGMKAVHMSQLVADGNDVHHNDWTGIWLDAGCRNVTLSNNQIHQNERRGLHIEISDHIKVFDNAIWSNGTSAGGEEGFGIPVTASRDVEIYNNTLAWNDTGISVVNSKRLNGTGGSAAIYSLVNDVLVHNNTILMKERPGSEDFGLTWRKTYAGGNLYNLAANNRGYDNRY